MKNKILSIVDHTLLTQTATWKEIKQILDDSIKYEVASACIPASYVKRAKEYVDSKLAICTVIGFPNGYSTTAVKVFETEDAIKNGDYQSILEEIKKIKKACGKKVLKVIIETCLLTEEEKIKMCKVVTESGAEYIKTSTGFSTGGATFEDVALMKKFVGENVKIKAAGGISSLEDAEKFMELGANRLGTSRIVKIIKGEKVKNSY